MLNKKKRKLVLFFGGSSFAAEHLVKQLQYQYDVINLSRTKVKGVDNIYLDFKDKNTFKNLKKIKPNKVEYLIYFTSHVPFNEKLSKWENCKIENIYALIYLLKKIKLKIGKIILSSSLSVYGDNLKKILDEKSVLLPDTGYAYTKYAQEKIFKIYCRLNNIKFLCLRLGYVFSENISDKRLIKKITYQIKNNKDLKIINGKKTNLALVHTHDVSQAVIKTIKKFEGTFNVAPAGNISLSNLVHKILKYYPNYNGQIKFIDENKLLTQSKISNSKINKLIKVNISKRIDDTLQNI